MNKNSCLFLLLSVVAANSCQGEIINVTRAGAYASLDRFFHGTLIGVEPTFMPGGIAASLDTVADVGTFINADFGKTDTAAFQMAESTISIPPTNFPDPPTLHTYRETVTIDSTTPVIRLLSAAAGPIQYQGRHYRFTSNVSVQFPGSFTVSGAYKVQGPTESVTIPFSTVFSSFTGNVSQNGSWEGFITLGDNFPATATIGVVSRGINEVVYRPANSLIFQGTIDGVQFQAGFSSKLAFVSALTGTIERLALGFQPACSNMHTST